MKIAINDADGWKYPNLALMKLSAFYKAMGASVERYAPLSVGDYDKVFSSKVFTFSGFDDGYLPSKAIKGGTGYGSPATLLNEIEHTCPDYSLYGKDFSMGFLTRGCNRNCEWCVVPDKEGTIRANADIYEFLQHKKVVLMDNNVLAHPHGIEQIEKMTSIANLRIDFNQGLDARLIDDGVARRLSKLRWLKAVRLACDHKGQIESVRKAVELLRWHNTTPARYFCYVLVKEDVGDAKERVRFLKGIYVDAYAQPYLDKLGTPPNKDQKDFARWCNHKGECQSRTWEDYKIEEKR